MENYKGVIERYKKFLPVSEKTPIVTLLEGDTPLIRFNKIEKLIGENCEVYGKYL